MRQRSEAAQRGLNYERKIEKITRRILHLDVKRDSRSGAGLHKHDIRDRYNEMPIFIEVKDRETLNLKEWWRDADAKASFGQAPIVVFPMETEDLCVMRYTDLLQIVKESADWRETAEDLQAPINQLQVQPAVKIKVPSGTTIPDIKPAVQARVDQGYRQCKNGHLIAPGQHKCQWKGCQYSALGSKSKRSKKNETRKGRR